jgi:WD40 repeat protein
MSGDLLTPSHSQDRKIRLYNWDGKALQEAGLLEANQGLVSALAFSPDGSKLAAGVSNIQFDPPRGTSGIFYRLSC